MGINPLLSNICCNVYANGEKKGFLNVILSASVCEISLQNETPNIKNIPPLTVFASSSKFCSIIGARSSVDSLAREYRHKHNSL